VVATGAHAGRNVLATAATCKRVPLQLTQAILRVADLDPLCLLPLPDAPSDLRSAAKDVPKASPLSLVLMHAEVKTNKVAKVRLDVTACISLLYPSHI
jgi:hypothetical protein